MPVFSIDLPVPSRSTLTVICVSSVLRVTWACRMFGSKLERSSSLAQAFRQRNQKLRILIGSADGDTQTVCQRSVRSMQVLDQHPSRLQTGKHRIRTGHSQKK